jgi:EAL domain-containing protein (putative c-di-GMP-specific phosphodiesterase class I)
MPIREISKGFSINNVVPYFQPIIDLTSQRVWRYECLARFIAANDKTFLPSEFLYLVEREHHMQALTEIMFCQSARYFRDLNMPWSINISHSDLENEQLAAVLLSHLNDYPNPERVSIEISALSALAAPRAFATFVEQSIGGGIGVFIDNVGAKPGNIIPLLNLPIRGIKLAGGLLKRYNHRCDALAPWGADDDTTHEYVDNIIAQCHHRSISVVAEHVETPLMLEQLTNLPIRYAQGFVFSPPQAYTEAVTKIG